MQSVDSHPKIRSYTLDTITLIICPLILGHLAIYNHFPLILGDSLGYIERGFQKEVNHHWALFYSLFLNVCSFDKSLLIVIFLQNLWICILIRLFISKVLLIQRYNITFLLTTIFLSLLSYLPQVSNLLMADIFTSLGLVSMVLFIYFTHNLFINIFLHLTMAFSIIAHGSHAPIYLLFLVLIFALNFVIYLFFKEINLKKTLKNILICLIVLVLASFVFKPIVNSYFNEPTPAKNAMKSESVSESRYHFIWFQLRKTEIYDEFLSEYCPQKEYKYLCSPEKMERIEKKGKFWLLHGPDVSWLKEIEDAGKTALLNPKYISFLLKERIHRSLILMQNNKFRNSYAIKGLQDILDDHLPIDARLIKSSPSYDKRLYTKSQRNLISKLNNFTINISSLFLLCTLLYIYKHKLINNCYIAIYTLVIAHLSNVVLMGLFGNIQNSRYVYRSSWLLIFALILLAFSIYQHRQRKF